MRKDAKTRIAVLVPALAAAFWIPRAATTPVSTPPAAHATRVCAVWTEDKIPVHLDRVEVTVKYAEPIGEVQSASFSDSALVDVSSVKRAPNGEPMSALLVLNTTRAVAGKWFLTLVGDTGECVGTVYVGNAKK